MALGRNSDGWYFIMALALASSMSPAIMPRTQARWKPEYADVPYREWLAQQYDSKGWSCCDCSDVHPAYGAYINEGKWYVLIDGVHYDI